MNISIWSISFGIISTILIVFTTKMRLNIQDLSIRSGKVWIKEKMKKIISSGYLLVMMMTIKRLLRPKSWSNWWKIWILPQRNTFWARWERFQRPLFALAVTSRDITAFRRRQNPPSPLPGTHKNRFVDPELAVLAIRPASVA